MKRVNLRTYLVKLDHVRVSNFLEYFYLARDPVNVLPILDSCLFEDLDGNVLFRENVLRHLDFAEGALAKGLAYDIVAQFSAGRVRVYLLLALVQTGVFLRGFAASRRNVDFVVCS